MARSTKRVARAALTTRKMIRATAEEWRHWDELARALGFVGVAPWMRRVANEAHADHTRKAALLAELEHKGDV